ncbi:twin-arginine translocation signal domain-containing protein [Lentzea tibetensis]|uniref:Twin-arginine translocation signal domain-containing protein n=1 Tax=Lentzea tibetensis TaxID=2591470 RepID=A0A563EKK7_9PSEU|nr:glycoside hydrolase family 88 protein [Lentzea tibetensis]TWP47245.1 twin-arginine translocation signal domain-containing protein [Lentzea tibetensis]
MTTSRRDFVKLGAVAGGVALGLGATGTAHAGVEREIEAKERTDWSVAVVESTMKRYTPETFGGWGYTRGLFLYGQYLVYKRTGNKAYLDYVKAWYDRFVKPDGTMDRSFTNLDAMRSGQMFPILHSETGDARYRTASQQIRAKLNTYKRTKEGGFWHAESGTRDWQLWSDGVYMVVPFIMKHGVAFGEQHWAYTEAVRQLLVYARNLQNPNGLFHHAFDESRQTPWSDKQTGRSAYFWGRAMGWYAMTVIEVLEDLPGHHPDRQKLIDVLRRLVRGIAQHQDASTGRWFQVVDKGGDSANWTETSCTSMYAFAISRGIQRGYLSPSYNGVARKGYAGVLDRMSLDGEGLTSLAEICIGTNVGDLPFYYERPRAVNDFHGLGAFLIMNEQLRARNGFVG